MTRGTRLVLGFLLGVALGMAGGLYYLFEMDEARRLYNEENKPEVKPLFYFSDDIRDACDYGYENDCPTTWAQYPSTERKTIHPPPEYKCEREGCWE